MTQTYDTDTLTAAVNELWESSAVPSLIDSLSIPAKSPNFDPEWEANGHLQRIAELACGWAAACDIPGITAEVLKLEGLSPIVFIGVPAAGGVESTDTAVFYGHLDKQPETEGWRDGLGPWKGVRDGDRLYGRGSADDTYAMYASLVAIEALHRIGGRHTRCIGLIETCEETGSVHLPAYLDALADRIGNPSLIVALDSGALSYDRLWGTMSLRSVVDGTLRVDILDEPFHCGAALGSVPSSFRIIRELLSRIEDERTGKLKPEVLEVAIPEERRAQLADTAAEIGEGVHAIYPFVDGARPVSDDPLELLINNTWRATMGVLAQDGLPPLAAKAHLLRTHTALELSFRFPPGVDIGAGQRAITELVTTDPPYGARVSMDWTMSCPGWNAPSTAPWLERAMDEASTTYFGKPPRFYGLGGAIPFTTMLGDRFPGAQYLVSGVLGPGGNAHGPNEFLHIPAAKKLSCCVAHVLSAHAQRSSS